MKSQNSPAKRGPLNFRPQHLTISLALVGTSTMAGTMSHILAEHERGIRETYASVKDSMVVKKVIQSGLLKR